MQSVQLPVTLVGLFGRVLTALFQVTPVVMVVTGAFSAQFSNCYDYYFYYLGSYHLRRVQGEHKFR